MEFLMSLFCKFPQVLKKLTGRQLSINICDADQISDISCTKD